MKLDHFSFKARSVKDRGLLDDPRIKKDHEAFLKGIYKKYNKILREIDSEEHELIQALEEFIKNYYESLGVRCNINIPPIFIDDDDEIIKEKSADATFSAVKNCIIIKASPINTPIANYQKALALTHEIYHSLATFKIIIENEDEIMLERGGMCYRKMLTTSNNQPPALEEGLAMLMEIRVKDLLSQRFPEEAHAYKALLEREVELRKQRSMDTRNVVITHASRNPQETISDNYFPNSFELVQYLIRIFKQKGENFLQLVEKARVQGRSLNLARETEKNFGKGSYAKIALATEQNAKGVLQWLKHVS